MLALILLACNGGDPEVVDPNTPTYTADVAPILRESCESCHSDDQIAPFTLNTYEEVSVIGQAVVESVEQRRMPPWLADPSCNDYQGDRWMDQEDIDTLRAWFDAGMPLGDAEPLPEFVPEGNHLDDFTHSVSISQPYRPNFEGSDDDYHCFVVDPGLETDGFVTGFEILPGDPKLTHHMIIYLPSSAGAVDDAMELDEAQAGEGYSCFGGPRVDASMIAAWAPGTMAAEYAPGTGIAIPADTPVVMQMHYNNGSTPEASDATEVLLRIEDQVAEPLYSFFWVNPSLNIPPDETAWVEESQRNIGRFVGNFPGSFKLHSIGPHMHTLGQSLEAKLVHPDGSETCLLDVPRWDFNWQMGYRYEEPVTLAMEDDFALSCTYDSTGREGNTRWGDGTGDEMCLTTLFVTVELD